jgi:glycosyltransferase involved in cell wall biosynthesis
MASILMIDDGIRFDGRTRETAPLGGAETAFVSLAEALAARGHEVRVHNHCQAPLAHRGVSWFPLDKNVPDNPDLYIANRGHRLLARAPKAGRTVFWIHNPATYLLKRRYLSPLLRRRPVIVFSGAHHAATYPAWAPSGGRVVIPYGVGEEFRRAEPPGTVPPRRAVFTSNPLRSLSWLLDLWRERIAPQVGDAELHIFSSTTTYGAYGDAKKAAMEEVLKKASALGEAGVVLREPLAKQALAAELAASRVLLYRGDEAETFCLAVGEAQAAGVPCVVQNIGCVAERVVAGKTGYVAASSAEFAADAARLLSDDGLWRVRHQAARRLQRGWGWAEAAAEFEKLMA